MPSESLARLLDLAPQTQFIAGNGEVAVLAEMEGKDSGVPARHREAIRWNAAQLRRCDRELLATWRNTLRMEISGLGKVLFCHATPQNSDDIFTRLTPEDRLVSIFAESDADVVVCGHTHMQFDRAIGRLRLLNAGSVGMPFGDPGAYWLLLGPHVEFHRTRYDLLVAASRIRQTHYPGAEEFAAHNVLLPPTEEKMLRAFGAT
jgi:diadenosine tetraphosphatase ApaH/serine/threonine PP2A family protein phosphatase